MTINEDLNVLYVEDDAMSRRLMKMLLTSEMGLSNITIFDDSTDFQNKVENLDPKPDIILLDIHMEPYTGFEMLEMLRNSSTYNQTPIVALTASVMNEEVQQLKKSGFNGCISKPLDMDAFPESLQKILNNESVWYITS